MSDEEMNYYSDLADAVEKYYRNLGVYSLDMASKMYDQSVEEAIDRYETTTYKEVHLPSLGDE